MAKKKIAFDQPHEILKELYRHYLDFQDFFARTGQDTIDYGPLTISLFDLQYGLDSLSPRKQEAVWYHVIKDMLQREAAEIMNITTVSVGQYVKQAMVQLVDVYFAEVNWDEVAQFMQYEEEKTRRREAQIAASVARRAAYDDLVQERYEALFNEEDEEEEEMSNTLDVSEA